MIISTAVGIIITRSTKSDKDGSTFTDTVVDQLIQDYRVLLIVKRYFCDGTGASDYVFGICRALLFGAWVLYGAATKSGDFAGFGFATKRTKKEDKRVRCGYGGRRAQSKCRYEDLKKVLKRLKKEEEAMGIF